MLKYKKTKEILLVAIILLMAMQISACDVINTESISTTVYPQPTDIVEEEHPTVSEEIFIPKEDLKPETDSKLETDSKSEAAFKQEDISNDEIISSEPYKGELELPVTGATGYTSVTLKLKASPKSDSETIETFMEGTGFEIMKEEGEWWLIQRGTSSGWLQHKYCLINLPDVIPSIIYDNTNTYSSKLVSSGKPIPNITGKALYSGRAYNERLEKDEYIMPVLYTMSKKIYIAQQYALKAGSSLKIYEAYRPYSVQQAIVNALTVLAENDDSVAAGINSPPWGMNWFIATKLSNHQKGYAIDVSLVKINSQKEISVGPYTCIEITDYTEYTMPTPIHELSKASVVFTTPVTSKSSTAWKDVELAASMNEAAINLQLFCTDAGLTPLASEWWHFNDLEAMAETTGNSSRGKYFLTDCYSTVPDKLLTDTINE